MIKLATVGTSSITKKFLSAVALSNRFKLSAVYSRTYEKAVRFAENYGTIPVYTDLYELAMTGIDAVYIASPNVCHYNQSKIFLENGINVICEKPIVCNTEEYRELKSLADKNGVVYMEAIMSMYSPGYDILHNAKGNLGSISCARIDFCQRSSRLDDYYSGIPQNIFDMSLYAGTLMDLGVYCVYGALDLFGMPKKIISKAHFSDDGSDMSGVSIFDYGNFSAILTYAKAGQSAIHSEIIGEKGTITVESISQYAGIKLIEKGVERPLMDFPARDVIMRGEVDAFADYIAGNRLLEYKEKSDLCEKVCVCMDKIKESAGIYYGPL